MYLLLCYNAPKSAIGGAAFYGIAPIVRLESMSIAGNLAKIRERIGAAAAVSGRQGEDITLIAVTKTVDADRIRQAVDAGVTEIGENYIQNALLKYPSIGNAVKWHMIGHLQTNKVRQAVPIFDLIQSVDSLRLAEEIGKRSLAAEKVMPVLIEVNISGEESKFGVSKKDVERLCEAVASVPGIKLSGLMGIAPLGAGDADIRRSFAELKSLWDRLPDENRRWLSMGMTSDFEAAIEEGSNMVRIGTAIFGPRS
jgi:pyridoxal phosphate enzyme (YggS family)